MTSLKQDNEEALAENNQCKVRPTCFVPFLSHMQNIKVAISTIKEYVHMLLWLVLARMIRPSIIETELRLFIFIFLSFVPFLI